MIFAARSRYISSCNKLRAAIQGPEVNHVGGCQN